MSPESQREVALQLALMAHLFAELSPLRRKVERVAPDKVEIIALAGFLHSFYTGAERIFKRITVQRGSSRLRGEFGHRELLVAMTQPAVSSVSVISEVLASRLEEYLNFRHVFRHAYSFELQWR